MSELSIYEKQLNWKKAANKKAEKQREDNNNSNEPSFQPTIYSNNAKRFEGQIRSPNESNSQNHIERRQNKGHKERNITSFPHGSSRTDIRSAQKTFHQPEVEDYDSDTHLNDNEYYNDSSGEGYLNAHFEHTSNDISSDHPESDTLSSDSNSSNSVNEEEEEPIIEMLERERRQWQTEREKLVQCIHLQQLELTQRSVAAHERAVDIAKEFARAIEGFEERLVSVESSVHKEILSIKGIAENILLTQRGAGGVSMNTTQQNNNNNIQSTSGVVTPMQQRL